MVQKSEQSIDLRIHFGRILDWVYMDLIAKVEMAEKKLRQMSQCMIFFFFFTKVILKCTIIS